ncbi:MAG: hypothetical protein K9J06_12385 [Flavobacteriales bacterium]|nr:hypothetical protein [Flavobacteriales bacterium]
MPTLFWLFGSGHYVYGKDFTLINLRIEGAVDAIGDDLQAYVLWVMLRMALSGQIARLPEKKEGFDMGLTGCIGEANV